MSKSKKAASTQKLEEQVDDAWKNYSLDAPRVPNPIPSHTRGLRRMCVAVHFVVPLSKVVIGAEFLNDCPTNPYVPKFILVGGLLQLCFLILLLYRPLRQPALLSIVGITMIIWMLIGSLLIIVEWKPDFFLGGWRYCNRKLFFFAFFVSIAEYVIMAILLLYICTVFAYSNPEVNTVQNV